MIKRYLALKEEHRNIVLMLLISIGVFAILTPLFLIEKGPLAIGWLTGSLLSVICYYSLYKGNEYLLSESTSSKSGYMAVIFYLIRFIVMGAGLILGAICTFKSEWIGGFNLFNFWGIFAGYLLVFVFIPVKTFLAARKEAKKEGGKN